MEAALIAFLEKAAADYPWVLMTLMVMGLLRLINKPLFAFWRSYVQSTPSTSDDAFLDKVEASPVWKAVLFVIDWTASVKIPPKKP